MKKTCLCLLVLAVFLIFASCLPASQDVTNVESAEVAEAETVSVGDDRPSGPVKKANGGKFVVGFIDLDPYPYTAKLLFDVIEGLKADGWISYDTLPFDKENVDAKELIAYLAAQDLGPYLAFSKDMNYYYAIDDMEQITSGFEEHAQKGDVDLMLAWETSSAKFALQYKDKIPVVAYPISNPVSSEIVNAVDYSGVKNVWSHTDTLRYRRQLQVFHEVFPFTNIGLAYSDASVAAVTDYEETAAALGVKLTKRQIAKREEDKLDAYYNEFFAAVTGMIEKDGIDAFLLSTNMMTGSDERVTRLIDMCTEKGIPIFVQSGDHFVEAGCLMTVQIIDSTDVGRFVSNTIGKALNGAKLEELPQSYISAPYLVMNINAAEKLDHEIPFEILMSCEKIYGGAG